MVSVVNFGRVAFTPLVEPLQAAFDAGPAAVGAVVSLVWLGTALPRLPLSYVLTRDSRRSVVVSGLALAGAAAFTASAADVRTLRIGVLAVGVASGAYFDRRALSRWWQRGRPRSSIGRRHGIAVSVGDGAVWRADRR